MKTKILLFVIFCLPIFVWGQKNTIKSDTLLKVEVTPPEFTGIQKITDKPESVQNDPLAAYLSEHFKYPDAAAECMIEGTGIVQFKVTPSGELTDFKVINSVCRIIDEEFIRVLKTTSGMWNPGLNNMKRVDMEKEVSMMFVANQQNKTNPKAYFTKLARNHFTKANILFLEKHNLRKALRNYDQTIKFFPYDASSLLVRGLCRYGLGDMEGALSDWERINRLGSFDASSFVDEYIEELACLKGYDEMIATIEK